eukprot:TRINITY_DN3101_c0_g1_i1.p1 TRINITY_DN3101_c0_g1~~TRINITY_DN3101_c0_g1_i1.p1  ORF type:complete len:782 (-),score=138.16 TRINITY_DN3101_c0_g1_i1:12-2099(-)
MKKNFSNIYEMSAEVQSLIPYYQVIKEVNIARNNLLETRQYFENMMAIPSRVKQIRKLLSNDINILQVHSEVRELEKMRDKALYQALAYPNLQTQLKDLFHSVVQLSQDLDERLWQLLDDHLELATERPQVLIKIFQVIYREKKLIVLRRDQAEDRGEIYEGTDYYALSIEKLTAGIAKRFDESMASRKDSEGNYDVQKAIDNSRTLMADLASVYDTVMHCFPESYNILNIYVNTYHNKLNDMMKEFAINGEKIPMQKVLLIGKWIKTYYEPGLARLGVEAKKPDLLQTLDPLIMLYRAHIRKLMTEWTARLIDSDKESEPEIVDGIYYTSTPKTLFSFVHQQISMVEGTKAPRLISATLAECLIILSFFQSDLRAKFEKEKLTYEIEYIIATINNSTKCYEYTQELFEKENPTLDDDYRAENIFEPVLIGFQEMTKFFRLVLIDFIYSPLEEDFVKFFSKEWEYEDTITSIIVTVDDYLAKDIQGHLPENYFKKLILETLQRTIECYTLELLSEMKNKFANPFNNKVAEHIRKDIDTIKDFYVNKWNIRDKVFKNLSQVLEDLADLMDVPVDKIKETYSSLRGKYTDANAWVAEGILNLRQDIDKKTLKPLLEEIKKLDEEIGSRMSKEEEDSNRMELMIPKEGYFTRVENLRQARLARKVNEKTSTKDEKRKEKERLKEEKRKEETKKKVVNK